MYNYKICFMDYGNVENVDIIAHKNKYTSKEFCDIIVECQNKYFKQIIALYHLNENHNFEHEYDFYLYESIEYIANGDYIIDTSKGYNKKLFDEHDVLFENALLDEFFSEIIEVLVEYYGFVKLIIEADTEEWND